MPSHQAVLGAVAAAGAGYAIYNRVQQQAVDREEAQAREELARMKKDIDERVEQQRQKDGIEAQQRQTAGYAISRHKEELLLFDLLQSIYVAAAQAHASHGRPSIELPLLKLADELDKPAEVVLGVGHALGGRCASIALD
eukprot:6738458-Prymnesium_polylepis.1